MRGGFGQVGFLANPRGRSELIPASNTSIDTPASQIFPTEQFHQLTRDYLFRNLAANDAGSLLLSKELMVAPLRAERLQAVNESMNLLAERLVEGAPQKRFEKRKAEMVEKSRSKGEGKL